VIRGRPAGWPEGSPLHTSSWLADLWLADPACLGRKKEKAHPGEFHAQLHPGSPLLLGQRRQRCRSIKRSQVRLQPAEGLGSRLEKSYLS
jgi:hypothetical protein